MLDWYQKHGISKLLLRNIVIAVMSVQFSAIVTLWIKLDRVQTECAQQQIQQLERLKNDRIRDLQDFQVVLGKVSQLETEVSSLRDINKKLQKRLK